MYSSLVLKWSDGELSLGVHLSPNSDTYTDTYIHTRMHIHIAHVHIHAHAHTHARTQMHSRTHMHTHTQKLEHTLSSSSCNLEFSFWSCSLSYNSKFMKWTSQKYAIDNVSTYLYYYFACMIQSCGSTCSEHYDN